MVKFDHLDGAVEITHDGIQFIVQRKKTCTDLDSDKFGEEVNDGARRYFSSIESVAKSLVNSAIAEAVNDGIFDVKKAVEPILNSLKGVRNA